jgi:transcriptional regulator with XRE-family HTH domain
MTDVELPSELVNRLHSLRISRGLTIQQMAEKCGIPKSSMESYMKMFGGAKRPGIDALISIADGMDVSIDWLVGRSVYSHSIRVTQKDYAMACFSVVSGLINWMRDRQSEVPKTIIQKESIAGIEDTEIAAKAMLEFLERVQLFQNTAAVAGEGRASLFDSLYNHLQQRKPETE